MILTGIVGDNSDLIKVVSSMYLKEGDRIADVTYGKGVFWRKIDLSKYKTYFSDIITGPEYYDFRELPYEDRYFDCVVLDPPYTHNPGKLIVDANYKNRETTKGMYHKDIINLYMDGMLESYRILKVGGYLWVKCKDEVETSLQRWSHMEIYNHALSIGFYATDLFVLFQKSPPILQHKNQKHARKNHSFLWIFKKPTIKEDKKMEKIYDNYKSGRLTDQTPFDFFPDSEERDGT